MLKSVSVKLFAALFALSLTFGVADAKTIKETKVQTNMTCETCKGKIDGSLKKLNGVIETQGDVKTKVVLVKYDADLTNEKAITKNIADLGYQADLLTDKAVQIKERKSCCSGGTHDAKHTGGCSDKTKVGSDCKTKVGDDCKSKVGDDCKTKTGDAKVKSETKVKTTKTSAK